MHSKQEDSIVNWNRIEEIYFSLLKDICKVEINTLCQRSPTFLAPGTSFMKTIFPCTGGGGDSSGGNASDGEWWGTEDLLARLPLTSCCVASFLTGRRWVPVRGLGGWGPLPYIVHSNYYICWVSLLLKLSKTPSIKEFIIQMLIPHPCLKKCGFEVYCMWLCSICKAINENIRSFFSL